jgi:hypothetical protein
MMISFGGRILSLAVVVSMKWLFCAGRMCATSSLAHLATKHTFGALAYYWGVPRDLNTKATYQLRLTTNLSDDVDHLSGPFRYIGVALGMFRGEHGPVG